jgi:hypothetical protein
VPIAFSSASIETEPYTAASNGLRRIEQTCKYSHLWREARRGILPHMFEELAPGAPVGRTFSLVGHEDGHGGLGNHGVRHAPEDHLSEPGMSIGTHHQKVWLCQGGMISQ